jgi:hypothetical protein
MTARRFPDDHEVDRWISRHFLAEADADASPVVDQLKAATADSINRFRANAPGMVANGLAQYAFLDVPDQDHTKIRGAVRQVMAAESAGLMPLCRHVNLIRPLVLICDPCVICCTECLPSRVAIIKTLGHRWNHQCDRCGVHVEILTPVSVGGLGFLTVSGHICSGCAADDQRRAADHIDRVVVVGGNRRARRAHRNGGAR